MDPQTKELLARIDSLESRLHIQEQQMAFHKHLGSDLSSKLVESSIPSSSGGGGGGTTITTKEEGVLVSSTVDTLNFVGAIATVTGGAATGTITFAPVGVTTNVQFNSSGEFAGSNNFNWLDDAAGIAYLSLGNDPGNAVDLMRVGNSNFGLGITFEPSNNFAIYPYSFNPVGSFNGGDIELLASQGGDSGGDGGHISLGAGGAQSGSGGNGGFFDLTGGSGDFGGVPSFGGEIEIDGGVSNGRAGSIFIYGGNAATGSTERGGDVLIRPGTGDGQGNGTGPNGRIVYASHWNLGGGGAQAYRVIGGRYVTNANPYINLFDAIDMSGAQAGYLRARVVAADQGSNDIFMTEFFQGAKNTVGVVTLVGGITYDFFYGDNAVVDAIFAVSGTNVYLAFQSDGAANYNVSYELWYMLS